MPTMINEVFALRDGEIIKTHPGQPQEPCRWFAVKLLPCPFPAGAIVPERADGALVQAKVIITAQLTREGWQWLPMSHPTKEAIGDYLFDQVHAEDDVWYCVVVTDGRQ